MPRKTIEERREYMRMWRAKNPDKVLANDLRDRGRQQEYRKSRLAKYAEYQRNSRAKSPKDHLVHQARARAKKASLPFDISVETIHWPTHCPVLGLELNYSKEPIASRKAWQVRSNTVTLDRHVNELGYVPGNVFVISHRANRIKSDASAEELMAVAQYAKRGLPNS